MSYYPRNGATLISDRVTFKPEALAVVRAFARSKPYQGTDGEKMEKFAGLVKSLSRVYGINPPALTRFAFMPDCYSPSAHTINLSRFSVVTLLHEFAHARFGRSEAKACRWSLNLFKKCFPRSFAKCHFRGHVLVSGS